MQRFESLEDDVGRSRSAWRTTARLFGVGIRCSNAVHVRLRSDYVISVENLHDPQPVPSDRRGQRLPGSRCVLVRRDARYRCSSGLWQTRRALRKYTDPDTRNVRSLASGLECALILFVLGRHRSCRSNTSRCRTS